MEQSEYYLVKRDALPEVFRKVMEVKGLVSNGKARSINQAIQQVGLSRSAYYKYRDAVLPFYDLTKNELVTLVLIVENEPGLLSAVINCLADAGCNVLSINQNIPINGLVDISILIETGAMEDDLRELVIGLARINGVRSCKTIDRTDGGLSKQK